MIMYGNKDRTIDELYALVDNNADAAKIFKKYSIDTLGNFKQKINLIIEETRSKKEFDYWKKELSIINQINVTDGELIYNAGHGQYEVMKEKDILDIYYEIKEVTNVYAI